MEYKIIILPVQTVTVQTVPVQSAPEESLPVKMEEIEEIEVEEIKKEESFDDETFKVEFDTQEEIIPKEKKAPEKSNKGRPKKRVPFSCCHCVFIGKNRNDLIAHKRNMGS